MRLIETGRINQYQFLPIRSLDFSYFQCLFLKPKEADLVTSVMCLAELRGATRSFEVPAE